MDEHRTRAVFRQHVTECLSLAESIYGINFGRVRVTFDLKGLCCGKAEVRSHPERGKTYMLSFNDEALKKDWEGMVTSTIPHEVAHLVAFADPSLKADGHNRAWKRIAISLGDSERGKTCHNIDLKPARRGRRYRYFVNGNVVILSSKQHIETQSGKKMYFCNKSKLPIMKEDFEGLDKS